MSTDTIFFIPPLHCASCSNHISSLLSKLRPRPVIKAISIPDHTLVVSHPRSLLASTIRDVLEKNGYEVFDMRLDPLSNERHPFGDEEPEFDRVEFEAAIGRWLPHRQYVDEKSRKRHEQFCETCRSGDVSDSASSLTGVIIESDVEDHPRTFIATLSIEGMTCSSCVSNVSRALEDLSFVHAARVSLVTHSAKVDYQARSAQEKTGDVLEAVADAGYEASIQDIEENGSSNDGASKSQQDEWVAMFAIQGMTCSSCVANVTKAVEALGNVREVGINLVQHMGTVTIQYKAQAEKVREAIEDAGYDAQLIEVDLRGEQEKETSRTVSIRIEGMHCQRCPGRIQNALDKFPLIVDRPLALDAPIVTVTYTPAAPNFTIRSVLSAVSKIDKAFIVSIYHPPSLEQRSRAIVAKERRHILYRIVLSTIIAIPTFVIGIVIMNFLSHDTDTYQYMMSKVFGAPRAEWATLLLSTPVYFFAADIFHRRTLHELKVLWKPSSKVPLMRRFYRFGSMNMLVSFGTTISYVASLAGLAMETANESYADDPSRQSYFDSVVFLTLFLLVGRYAEAQMKSKSGDAVGALGRLRPSTAHVVLPSGYGSASKFEEVEVDLVDVGDCIKVFNGTSSPCDGVVVEGRTHFDESSLTGESKLVSKESGHVVYAGTVNRGDAVAIRVTGSAGTSMLDSIINVVREGQSKRAPIERIADALTAYFVPGICVLAVVTWIGWLCLGLSPFWSLQFAIAVFVIACPCGLGLAAPTVLFVGAGMAAKRGILVKGGGEAFQEASRLDVVVFDKTGTITEGAVKIENADFLHPLLSKGDVLAALQAVEENSSHPLAKAALAFAKAQAPNSVSASGVAEVPGRGLKGTVDMAGASYDVLVGNEALLASFSVPISPKISLAMDLRKSEAKSVILLAVRPVHEASYTLAATFAATDPVRPEASDVVASLQKRGIDVWLLSGDNERTAHAVGAQVGIPMTNIIGGAMPDQKASKITYLQRALSRETSGGLFRDPTNRRAIVAMVGDGINDAPALTAADVGIAIGSGSDVSIASASFVLLTSRLQTLLTLIDLSRAVFRRVKVNFAWAAVYNVVALPFAAGLFYWIRLGGGGHLRLDPAFAALAMALSSISVVGSSLLLRTQLWGVGFRDEP